MLSFVKSIPQTFYSRTFYASLIRRGQGIGAGFIVLQVLLSLSIPAVRMIAMLPTLQEKTAIICDHLPDLTLKDNKLSIDRPSPYNVPIFEDNDKKPFSILFDTSPHAADVVEIDKQMKAENLLALVTSDFFVVRKQGGIEIHNFNESIKTDASITHDQWVYYGKMLLAWGIPLFFILMVVISLIGVFVVTAVKSLFVKLFALILTITPDFSITPDFAGGMRLSAAAGVPMSLIGFLLSAVNALAQKSHPFSIPTYVDLIVWVVLVVYALMSANKEVRA